MARQSLGKGFDALIPKDLDPDILTGDETRIQKLLITDIIPNPDQPRREFDKAQLDELAQSISRHGVLQPIIVVRSNAAGSTNNGYIIVAGERRWRAAGQARLKEIPAIVRSLEELEQIELSLIENIQRVDLSPLEQALAVLKLQQQFNLSLDQISQKLGKASSTVSNLTRLLQLPEAAGEALRTGQISEGHARAILALRGNETKQNELLSCILDNKWTVRQAEEFVLKAKREASGVDQPNDTAIVANLSRNLGIKVVIKHTAKGGQIIIPFKNEQQLQKIAQDLQKKA